MFEMLCTTTTKKFIALRPVLSESKERQERKEENISPNLARFADLREVSFFRFCKSDPSEKV
jgi:hypothetical protein